MEALENIGRLGVGIGLRKEQRSVPSNLQRHFDDTAWGQDLMFNQLWQYIRDDLNAYATNIKGQSLYFLWKGMGWDSSHW